MKHYRGEVLIGLLLLIVAEMIWSWRNDKKVYRVKETFSNIAILAGFQLSKLLFAGYQLAMLGGAAHFAVITLPHNAWTFALCFLLADLVYYWFHRTSHHWEPLWAFHLIHHSSQTMNLTTAYRLNWFGALISPLFFIPLVLLGFPPEYIVTSYALNLLYQFFLHTESIGKLGIAERFMDTPSSHRVHHGSNDLYLDKNFGGVLIIWDRIFGTYQPETEKVKYGLTTGFVSNNPFVLVFKGFIDLFTGKPMLKPNHHTKTNIMNTTTQSAFKSQKFIMPFLVILGLSILLGMGACKKNNSSSSPLNDTLTVDDAADAVTESVSTESAGMVTQSQTAVIMVDANNLDCGVESDTTISGQNASGASVTYNYDLSWNRLMTCNNNIPQSFQFNFSGQSSYSALRISSSDSSNAQLLITGLQPSSTQYLLNMTYVRNGSETSKIGNKNSFTSTINISSSNIAIDKSSDQIVSGTATVTIAGETTTGRSFSYNGTLTFLGNKQATLVLGNGNSYSIVWS